MKEIKCGIYKIQNLINNKKYIGQSIDIYTRWRQHKKGHGISHGSAIGLAIQKYGEDNFSFEILEECSPKELDMKEKYYIEFYNSYFPNGYNIATAGEQSHNLKADVEVSCYDLQGNLIQTFYSIRDADRYGYSRTSISAILNNRGYAKTAYNMYWAKGHERNINIIKPIAGKNGGKTVYQYDINNGNYITSFNSLAEAERYLGKIGGNKNISAACLGKRKTAYDYYWSYSYNDNYFNIKEKEN